MRRGVSLPNFGDFADPAQMLELAGLAEATGWDGFFLWDHIAVDDGLETADPWTMLGAISVVTDRIRLGTMITPLPRRRPWVVARQATTVDHLSQGRLVLGVGIGSPADEEFGRFGEPTDARVRADMLDEALGVLQGIWGGEPFAHQGTHYHIAETVFAPRPMQTPSIPIWVAAEWPNRRPLRRAARFDGVFPVKTDMSGWCPEEVQRLVSIVVADRGTTAAFDVVISGSFDLGRERGAELERAGATWFLAVPQMGDTPGAVATELADGP
jgi:alkanesulfonate monooxygenase SsuD/methylene tetrahydromethanopterin reductase-like flavin-dependent oxidoreductase (luciferase family)